MSDTPIARGVRRRRTARLLAVAALVALRLAFALLSPVSAYASTATEPATNGTVPVTDQQRTAATVEQSIVMVTVDWTFWVYDGEGYLNDGEALTYSARCSGFVVGPDGHVVTAGHCVDPDELRVSVAQELVAGAVEAGDVAEADAAGFVDHIVANWTFEGHANGSDPDRVVQVHEGVAASGLDGGRVTTARVLEVRGIDEGDVALLKVERTDMTGLLLADDAQVGQEILAVGYAASTDAVTDPDATPSYKDGQISSTMTRGNGSVPVHEISAAVSGGMSGGPTVDMQGRVVGVNSFSISGEPQAFNFVSTADLVAEVLSRNGVTNERGPIGEAFDRGLDAYFAGDRATALAAFDEVLDQQPSHRNAQHYRELALDLPGGSRGDGDRAADVGDDVVGEVAGSPQRDRDENSYPDAIVQGGIAGGVLVAIGWAVRRLHASRRSGQVSADDVAVDDAVAGDDRAAAETAGTAQWSPDDARREHPSVNGEAIDGSPAATITLERVGTCDGCGGALTSDAQFCPACGTRQT